MHTVALPTAIDAERTQISFKDGILLTLPKIETSKRPIINMELCKYGKASELNQENWRGVSFPRAAVGGALPDDRGSRVLHRRAARVCPGNPEQDWYEAEALVDRLFNASATPRQSAQSNGG